MSLPISYSIDEKDLDDAALWAVIDSTAASHSIASSKPIKSLPINFQSPSAPNSHPSSSPKLPQNPRNQPRSHRFPSPNAHRDSFVANHRPHKMARSLPSEMSETTSPLVLVRTVHKTSPTNTMFSAPESFLSPEIGRSCDVSEASPPGSSGRSDERDVMRHSLSGSFPSVSLFKEYQNAAMAVIDSSLFLLAHFTFP